MVSFGKAAARGVSTRTPGTLGTYASGRDRQPAVPGAGGQPGGCDQWQRGIQPGVGGVYAGGDPVFREEFPAPGAQPDGRALGAVQPAGNLGQDGGDRGLRRYRARGSNPGAAHGNAGAGDDAARAAAL